ncbi:uncharacterized protein FIBRA_05343 [Fibroporia radiculosa]|uniref:Glycoside hydrolase family 3 N-terminal domain-containing protein n=1 Tax=Fibroporia radiculosa TaxID=599839 RepID=J4H3G2_9APHY|nr:uncharacterized protein FIBRA_05343 [Fibroporia radiculosa]CCM03219.1 predicted protein [Fibroporia radiculosa]
MALAATGSVDLAERVSSATGKELKLAGINWAFSPVADVNSDPRNPVIGVRSFGDNPNEVARYVQAVTRGLTAAGVAPSAKHFPGHGNTHIDSHLGLPRILSTSESLAATELPPFHAVISPTGGDSSIASIMTGHMALPNVTGDETPCSLSRAITTGLLREKLGYDGVVVTDCLEMEAVSAMDGGVPEGAVRALEAGADIVMVCHRFDRHLGALKATYEAVKQGRLDMDALRASGERIARMKDSFAGSWDSVLAAQSRELSSDTLMFMKKEHAELSKEAYARSVALFRPLNPGQTVLPLRRTGHVVLLTPRMESINLAVDDSEGTPRVLSVKDGQGCVRSLVRNTAGPSYEALSAAMALRVQVYHIVYAPEDGWDTGSLERVVGAEAVVFAVRNGLDKGQWQIKYLQDLLRTASTDSGGPKLEDKLVLISTCGPYDLLDLGRVLREDLCNVPSLATFEFTVPAMHALTAVLFEEASPSGKIPVSRVSRSE